MKWSQAMVMMLFQEVKVTLGTDLESKNHKEFDEHAMTNELSNDDYSCKIFNSRKNNFPVISKA